MAIPFLGAVKKNGAGEDAFSNLSSILFSFGSGYEVHLKGLSANIFLILSLSVLLGSICFIRNKNTELCSAGHWAFSPYTLGKKQPESASRDGYWQTTEPPTLVKI